MPLTVTGTERSVVLPDTPVMSDFLPSYEAGSCFGIGVPRGTSADIVDKLNKAVNAGLADPQVNGRLAELGAVPLPGAPHHFAKFLDDETKRYRRVIRSANIEANCLIRSSVWSGYPTVAEDAASLCR